MIIINSSLWSSPVQDERGVTIGVVRGVVLNKVMNMVAEIQDEKCLKILYRVFQTGINLFIHTNSLIFTRFNIHTVVIKVQI